MKYNNCNLVYVFKMILYNIKQKKNSIKSKKNVKKKAEVENLEEMGYQANLDKGYKPLTEPLNKFVEETHEVKKGLVSN